MLLTQLKQYKRFFAFGCSFTEHIYPTWADVVRKSIPDAKFYNFGRSGAGNLQISVRIAEANTRYKFDENDLVMVMFTSFNREDRWVTPKWQSYGNVYNNDYYDKSFYKYCDPLGYAVRDCALIELVSNYLQNTPATVCLMPSSPIGNFVVEETDDEAPRTTAKKIISLYENMYNKMPMPLLDYLGNKYKKVVYYDPITKEKHEDSHPNPLLYYEYINNNVVKLKDESLNCAIEWTDALDNLSDLKSIILHFHHTVNRNDEGLF